MRTVFADTHFFIALLSVRDADHREAARWFETNTALTADRHFEQAGFTALLAKQI